ncbi:hypothetical protein N7478_009294 [Penicillium angulare]|uniref:uncharacterized protein n=1 Tax=Penicillium angulare TaxID=116970 RepID=UPI00253F9980|nr:uncharacterized protein N7478_009294 [Penicillium angulare]KAJ5266486.1 hypothetical protein N7478_009294 [Penicillium angulare]
MSASSYTLYNYTPSLAAAIIALLLFLAATGIHIFLAAKRRTKFLIAFIIGGFLETIGYAARAVSAHQHPIYSTMPYALQSLFILIAPSLFAASIYMILGRIIVLTDGDSRSIIPARRMTKIFVLGDVLAFFVQAGGGGIMSSAKSNSTLKLGEKVIIVGLIVQILSFGFFVFVSLIFHRRIVSNPTPASMTVRVNWHRYLIVLYIASAMVMIRCVYRVVEYIQGQTGELQSHEYFAYIFDAALIFLVMVIFMIFHPSQVVSKPEIEGYETEIMYKQSDHHGSSLRMDV